MTRNSGGSNISTPQNLFSASRQRRIVQWLVTFVLVPLLPLALAAIFRAMREIPASGSLWWCSEVPFFSITLCAAGFVKCRELAMVEVAHKTAAQDILPWLELLLAGNGFMSLVFLSLYYSDTYLSTLSVGARNTSTMLGLVFATFSFGLGVTGVVLEYRIQAKKDVT